MKKRAEKREIPQKSHYVETTLKDKKFHFRLPNIITSLKFLQTIPAETLDSLGKLSKVKNKKDVLKNLPDLLSFLTYVVGLTWHNEDHDLDIKQLPGESNLDYGARLFDELYEDGFTSEEVMELGGFLFKSIVDSLNQSKEVEEKKTISAQEKV